MNSSSSKTNFYRSRNKETKSSTSSKAPSGWTLEKTIDSGDFGAWSSWSTTPVAATLCPQSRKRDPLSQQGT